MLHRAFLHAERSGGVCPVARRTSRCAIDQSIHALLRQRVAERPPRTFGSTYPSRRVRVAIVDRIDRADSDADAVERVGKGTRGTTLGASAGRVDAIVATGTCGGAFSVERVSVGGVGTMKYTGAGGVVGIAVVGGRAAVYTFIGDVFAPHHGFGGADVDAAVGGVISIGAIGTPRSTRSGGIIGIQSVDALGDT